MKKLLLFVALCGVLESASAFPFPVIGVPEKPAPLPPPVAPEEIVKWLQNAQNAADAARKAQREKQTATRNAQILRAFQEVGRVADAHTAPPKDWRAALEIVGLLAREMNGWGLSTKEAGVTTEWVMIEIRGKDLLKTATGNEKAAIHFHLAEIGRANDFGHIAFENYNAITEISGLTPDVYDRAGSGALETVLAYDRPKLKELFARMAQVPLSGARKTFWENQRDLSLVENLASGDAQKAAQEAARTRLKAQIWSEQTPVETRETLAEQFAESQIGEEKIAVYDLMLARPQIAPQNRAKWLLLRADAFLQDRKLAEAVRDYDQAAKTSPLGSASQEKAIWSSAQVRVAQLGQKTEAIPFLEKSVAAKTLSDANRFQASQWLFRLAMDAKNYPLARTHAQKQRTFTEKNEAKIAIATANLVEAQIGVGEWEAAVPSWTAIDFEKATDWSKDRNNASDARARINQTAVLLYNSLMAAKKYPLAQTLVDSPLFKSALGLGDATLAAVNLDLDQKKFDAALLKLRALQALATLPADKTALATMISNVEKQKAQATQ